MRFVLLVMLAVVVSMAGSGCALVGGVTPLYETTIEEFAPDGHGNYHPTTRVQMRTRHTQEAATFSWEDERDIDNGSEYIKKRALRQDKETDLSVAESLGLARAAGTAELGANIGAVLGAAFGQYMQMETVRVQEAARVDMARIEARVEQLEAENERLRSERDAAVHHDADVHDGESAD